LSRQSLSKAHKKITELTWEPTFATPATRFGTDYTFEKAPKKDPLKQIMRSYFPMEEEKDNRVFGAMDGAIRGNMFRQVQQRWMEWQKLFLSIIPFPEISAARAMPMAIDAVPNPEIHNGLAVQMIDEVRHSTIQMNLKRLYMNHYIDPAGFDISEKAFANNYAGTIGRQFGEGFITGDAITAANIYLTVVAETAFTNTLFVAMPSEAAANGDYLLPTVFHSVQSDESRHISNGYSILLMALADEDNRQLLERDLRYAWWNNHCVVDAAIGTFSPRPVRWVPIFRLKKRSGRGVTILPLSLSMPVHGMRQVLQKAGSLVRSDCCVGCRFQSIGLMSCQFDGSGRGCHPSAGGSGV